MKIAFIGGVKFSLELLTHILKKGWSVSIVFSYDDSKKKFYSDFVSFEKITNEYHIKHLKVNNINDPENLNFLKKINPDLILVMGWSQLLKAEIIKIPKLGVIGSHPTELPKYRGRAPLPWSIIKNLKESALTFFYIQESIDDGDILDQRKFEITQNDDATSLYQKMTNLGKQMLIDNLLLIEKGEGKRTKQDPKKFIESWPKRIPEDGKINWSKTAKEIHTLIRATTHPYPGAFSFFKNKKFIIWKATLSDEKSEGIGKIMSINSARVKIGTGKGCIIVHNATLNDQHEKPANELILKDFLGTILGDSHGEKN